MQPNPHLPRLRVATAAVLTASFLYSGCLILRSGSDLMTPQHNGSDHLSHANAAVMFFYRGCEIYRVPVNELLQCDDSPAATQLAERLRLDRKELFRLPERAKADTPLWLNWAGLARVYPPGLYCYTAPEGVCLECTELPLWVVCAFSLLKYSLAAHVLLWFLFDFLLVHYRWDGKLWGVVPGWSLVLLVMLAVQVQVCIWSLQGIYDAVAVLFLVLMVIHYKRQLWAHVLFFFAVAVFLHFRSLWFFPVAGLAAIHLARQGLPALIADRRQAFLLLSASMLLAVSGFFFLLGYPAMVRFPLNNPLYLKTLRLEDVSWIQAVLFAGLVGVLAWRRDWLLLASVAGVMFFLLNTRQLQHWHSLALIPLLLCSRDDTLPGLFRGAMSYAILSFLFVQVMPFGPAWLRLYYLGV